MRWTLRTALVLSMLIDSRASRAVSVEWARTHADRPAQSAAPVHAPSTDTVRVGAWTAYLAPNADAARVRRDRDVLPFVSRDAELRWYGSFAHAGTVHARIELIVPRGDTVRLALRVAHEPATSTSTMSIAHDPWRDEGLLERTAIGRDASIVVDFGNVDITGTGYWRFALRARGARASAVGVRALLLDGTPLREAHFNEEPRRNAASVHLRYPVDSTWDIVGFYNEVTAVEDPVDTYYMATGFARGYFGMQVNSPTERRVIFSVWDAGNGAKADDRSSVAAEDQVQLVAKGEGVEASVFGNEGTGGHSHLVTPWRTGTTQKFYVAASHAGSTTTYTGYWFDDAAHRWRLIASFRAPRDGLGLRRLYSFSEDFGGSRGDVVRKARYGPAWVKLASGEWRELTTATFSHDPTGKVQRLDRYMGVEHGRFFLQHGGFVTGFTTMGDAFTRPASGEPPAIDLPFVTQAP